MTCTNALDASTWPDALSATMRYRTAVIGGGTRLPTVSAGVSMTSSVGAEAGNDGSGGVVLPPATVRTNA